jgi:hypothetical protein
MRGVAHLTPPLQEFRVGLPPAVQVQSGGLDDPKLGKGWGASNASPSNIVQADNPHPNPSPEGEGLK